MISNRIDDSLKIEILMEKTEEDHFHEDAELLFVLEGELELWVEEYQFKYFLPGSHFQTDRSVI